MNPTVALNHEALSPELQPLLEPRQRVFRDLVFKAFKRIEEGHVTLRDHDGTYEFGNRLSSDALRAAVVVFDPGVYLQVATRGDMGAGESWMDGGWTCDDLATLSRILLRNSDAMQALDSFIGRVGSLALRAYHHMRRNSVSGSRANIGEHYDLGNSFYRLWLDPTMTYSCAIFDDAAKTLEQAQVRKYDVIAQALDLRPGDSVLEIGCGWGGFALHAAGRYGCHVTATTISREQHRIALQRVRQARMGDCVDVVRKDYRDLTGAYDKIVSVEMFEAVGYQYQDRFFRVCADRLKPGGRMLLQTITIAEERYDIARKRVDFIQRYIFPGGALPSNRSLADRLRRNSALSLLRTREIGPHYATTLAIWYRRFLATRDEILKLGFDRRFLRMWEFYLCYCQAGFEERSIGTAQVLIERK